MNKVQFIKIPIRWSKNTIMKVFIPNNSFELINWIYEEKLLEKTSIKRIVGFDVEWAPQYVSNKPNKVGLIQMATQNSIILIQMNKFPNYIPMLYNLISSKYIVKVF